MRFVTLLAVVALLAVCANAAPYETSPGHIQKISNPDPRPYPPTGDVGGDDIANAVDMVSLPFHDDGTTWAYSDAITFADGNTNTGYSTSPDVFYSYTPDADACITVDLCDSQFDTMVWVLDEDLNIIASNDDGAACVSDYFVSQIGLLNVVAGVKYYYVVDGYDGSGGPFDLDVWERDCPPPVECPPEAMMEGEGCADPADYDAYNGGCNSDPVIFSELACSGDQIVICGSTYNYEDFQANGYRDTDWYNLVDVGSNELTVTGRFESSGQLYLLLIDPPCAVLGSYAAAAAAPRDLVTMVATPAPLDPGQVLAIFASKHHDDPGWYECTDPESWPYVMTIDGHTCPPVPTETETWGGVKNLFK